MDGNVNLKDNERIDDLERNGYRIIQNSRRFCFGMDAVLLSGFVWEGESGRAWANRGEDREDGLPAGRDTTDLKIADLGTGTGIIPLLLHGRLGNPGPGCSRKEGGGPKIIGLEIQEEMQDMAQRSVCLNGLESEICMIRGDLREAAQILGRGTFDVVTSNPPYMKAGGGLTNPGSSKAISRHEILCTLEDVVSQAAALLKSGGRFYLVHRPERLAEILETLRRFRLEPKRLRMVHSFADSEAAMVLIESAKGGNPFLKVERPLVIYQEKNKYTSEVLELYYY
ncbi:MAG: tRNA1(Val) (adenine(37)-N6)-methyltransferase [Parasporobacterium sp.]|nr:tRNA1(Val) (adenine(37)-N6)-methyltransferase [Parasporobacterium sp.]